MHLELLPVASTGAAISYLASSLSSRLQSCRSNASKCPDDGHVDLSTIRVLHVRCSEHHAYHLGLFLFDPENQPLATFHRYKEAWHGGVSKKHLVSPGKIVASQLAGQPHAFGDSTDWSLYCYLHWCSTAAVTVWYKHNPGSCSELRRGRRHTGYPKWRDC